MMMNRLTQTSLPSFRIAVVGATGNVGRTLLTMIMERGWATPNQIDAVASTRSAGTLLQLAGGYTGTVQALETYAFARANLVIFATESDVSACAVPRALAAGCTVIDSSSHFRMHPEVPLIVPPVNSSLIVPGVPLYAHANCIVSPLAVVLAPLHRALGLQRLHVATYQSVSGAGLRAVQACIQETASLLTNLPKDTSLRAQAKQPQHHNIDATLKLSPCQAHASITDATLFDRFLDNSTTDTRPPGEPPALFPHAIGFNVFPEIGGWTASDLTQEETKVTNELHKILSSLADTNISHSPIRMSVTCVRVPVLRGHSMALDIDLAHNCHRQDILNLLHATPQIVCHHDPHAYSTPHDVVGTDMVYVGRIRWNPSRPDSLQMWVCTDNLRRGAATDSMEIAEKLLPILGAF